MADAKALQQEWAKVVAHAWKNSAFMTKLRTNPKAALEEYGASTILGSGILLPLPDISEKLAGLSEEQLTEVAKQDGLFGVMRAT